MKNRGLSADAGFQMRPDAAVRHSLSLKSFIPTRNLPRRFKNDF